MVPGRKFKLCVYVSSHREAAEPMCSEPFHVAAAGNKPASKPSAIPRLQPGDFISNLPEITHQEVERFSRDGVITIGQFDALDEKTKTKLFRTRRAADGGRMSRICQHAKRIAGARLESVSLDEESDDDDDFEDVEVRDLHDEDLEMFT